MSLALYDSALVDKVKNWMSKSDIQIYSPEDAKSIFELNADRTDDKPLKLPLICVTRATGYHVTIPTEQPLSYDGLTLEATADKSLQLNAIPISIQYQLEIYTRYFKDADELARNMIFNLVNFPKVTVAMKYNEEQFYHDSTITLNPEVVDGSAIPERMIKGQFTKLVLSLDINDAYLWDIRVRDNYTIDVDIQVN